MSASFFSISCRQFNRCLAVSHIFFLLIALLTFGVIDARAGTIRASAASPIFLWTDESLSVAQHVATSISDTFGKVHDFGPGTFIGGGFPGISVKTSPTEKTTGKGNAFGWTIGVRGSNSNGNSSGGNAGGASSLVQQISTLGQLGGAGGGSAIVTTAWTSSGSTEVGNSNSGSVQVVANPLPPTLLLFASGLGALGLLGWRRKRQAA